MALLTKVLLCFLLLSTIRESHETKTKSEKKEDDIFDFFNDDDDEFFSESNDYTLVSDTDDGGKRKNKKRKDDEKDGEFGHDFYGVPSDKDEMYGPFSFLTDELRPKLPKIPDPPKRKYYPTTTTNPPPPVLATTRQPQPPPPPPPPPQPQPTPAPAKQESQRVHKKQPGRPYAFAYGVNDVNSGTSFKQAESSDGQGGTTGQYKVQLPDGRIQTVNYIADKNGYQANILYDGEARIPERKQSEQPQSNHHHPAPPSPPLQPQEPPPPLQEEQNFYLNQNQNLHGTTTPVPHSHPNIPNPTQSHVTGANEKTGIAPETSLKINQYNVLTDKVVEATPREIPQEQSQEQKIINQPPDDDRSLVDQPGPPYHPHPTSDNQNHQTVHTQKVEIQPNVQPSPASHYDEPHVIDADNEQAKTSSKSQLPGSIVKEGERGFKYSTEIYHNLHESDDNSEARADHLVQTRKEEAVVNIMDGNNNPQNQIFLSPTLMPPKLPATTTSTPPSTSTSSTTTTTTTSTTSTTTPVPVTTTQNLITTVLPIPSRSLNEAENFSVVNQAASENQKQSPHQILQLSLGSLPGDDSPRYNKNYHKTLKESVPSSSSASPLPATKNIGTVVSEKTLTETTQTSPQTSPETLKIPLTRLTTQKSVNQRTKQRRPTTQLNLNALPEQRSSAQPNLSHQQTSTPSSRSPQNYRVDLLKPINVSPGPAYTTSAQPRSSPFVAPHGQFGTRLHQGNAVTQEAAQTKTDRQTKNISRKPRHITQGSETAKVQLPETSYQTKSDERSRTHLLPVAKNRGILDFTQQSATPRTNIIQSGHYTQRPAIHISSTLPAKYRTLKTVLMRKVPVLDELPSPEKQEVNRAVRRGKKIKEIRGQSKPTVISESNGEYVSFIAVPVSVSTQAPVKIDSERSKIEHTPDKSSSVQPTTSPLLGGNPSAGTELREELKIPQPTPTKNQHRLEKVSVARNRKRRGIQNSFHSPIIQPRAHASAQGEGMLPQLGRRDSTARPIF